MWFLQLIHWKIQFWCCPGEGHWNFCMNACPHHGAFAAQFPKTNNKMVSSKAKLLWPPYTLIQAINFFVPSSCSPLLVYSYLTISSRIFENLPQNGPEYSHRNLAITRFLFTAVRKKHRGLAVLVGLIVKLSPRANTPWVGKGPPCQSLGGKGAAKAWYLPLVLLWESQYTGHVCL